MTQLHLQLLNTFHIYQLLNTSFALQKTFMKLPCVELEVS